MTYERAKASADWTAAYINKPIYVVVSSDGTEFDSVAAGDWDTPHERNRKTPQMKSDGWKIHETAQPPLAAV